MADILMRKKVKIWSFSAFWSVKGVAFTSRWVVTIHFGFPTRISFIKTDGVAFASILYQEPKNYLT